MVAEVVECQALTMVVTNLLMLTAQIKKNYIIIEHTAIQ